MSYSPPYSIQIKALGARRGLRILFEDITMNWVSQDIIWVQGPNGCGKTTFLRSLATLFPYEGSITYSHPGIWWIGVTPPLNPCFTVTEQLHHWRILYAEKRPIPNLLEQINLAPLAQVKTQILSMGLRQKLSLSRLFYSDQRRPLWLLDEPFSCLDEASRLTLKDLILNHQYGGGITVFTSHEIPSVPFTQTLKLDTYGS